MPVRRHYLGLALLLIIGAAAIIAASALVFAQDRPLMEHAGHIHGGEATVPAMPGQDAFGTIQEIVRILDADPAKSRATTPPSSRSRLAGGAPFL
jgi:hypothetical protein